MSRSPINSVTWIFWRLIAALANMALKQISSRPRYVLHLAILALSGVTALAFGAAGASHWFGQHEVNRGTAGYSKGSGAGQGKGKDVEPPPTALGLPPNGQAKEGGDQNPEGSEQVAVQPNYGNTETDRLAPPLEPDELARPRLSSRSGERPQDDARSQNVSVTAAAKKEPLKALTYQVASGDTLLDIAEKFGISPDTIIWANDLEEEGELLQVDQSLTILPVSGVLHKVKEGDNLLSIAFAHEASPEDIIEANALEDANMLRLDQEIVVPRGRQVPPPAPVPPLQVVEHQVRPGDTVGAIALMHAVEPIAIVRANGMANPDAIAQGQQLKVPGGKPVEARAAPAVAGQSAPAPTTSGRAEPPPTADASRVLAAQQSPPPAQTANASNKGDEIVAAASSFAGATYTWGGHSPATGFDCSGFTWYIYKQVGINIPLHDLWGQVRAGRAVKRGELLPGDLVFFQNTYQPGLSHSGIYVGNGRFISAASEGQGVRFDRLDDSYWGPRYFGAGRPW
ncbi:MAG: LysM peptidoglycan-binding domain-containing protein [Chloroflexi bacterium]|nr:LysM peptidoglycan-binding domain-containing protein [Chloroflexota bacterium]